MTGIGRLGRKVLGIGPRPRATDPRGRRIVAVIECILNQNARDEGAATFPAMSAEVVRQCRDRDVGIVQMPCPEIAFLGHARRRQPGESIRQALDTEDGRARCRTIATAVADRLEEYTRNGHRIVAILGGNPESPGCAVHQGPTGLLLPSGVLMRELQGELRARGLDVPFRGMRDSDPGLMAEDLLWLERVLTEDA